MTQIHASAERIIDAPAETVYGYLADHQQHHQRFLPAVFSDFRVEEGGVGAGTVLSYSVRTGGRKRAYRARVSEPEPGRVLTETMFETGAVTTFTVDPAQGGSRVRIETEWPTSRGPAALLERAFVPRFLRKTFVDELERLQDYTRSQSERG